MLDRTDNPYAARVLPPTEKQILYARHLAMKTSKTLPWEVQQDRKMLAQWIDKQRSVLASSDALRRPSSKQVAFAERIARMKRTSVPDECFQDRTLMSRWIDCNKH